MPANSETRNYVKQITSVYKNTTHPYLAEIVAPSPVFAQMKR